MRKSVWGLLLSGLMTVSMCVEAQDYSSGNESTWIKSGWGVGALFGPSLFFGDVKQYGTYPVGKYENERKIAFGLQIHKEVTPFFNASLNIIKGNLAGVIRPSKKFTSKLNDLYFTSGLMEFSLSGRFYPMALLSDNDGVLKPYASLGAGLATYDTKLKTLSTLKKIKNASGATIAIPISVGCDFRIIDNLYANIDISMRMTMSDDLDALESSYRGGNDKYSITSVGVKYIFGGGKSKSNDPQTTVMPVQEMQVADVVTETQEQAPETVQMDTAAIENAVVDSSAMKSVSSLTEGTVAKTDSVATPKVEEKAAEVQSLTQNEQTEPQVAATVEPKPAEQTEQSVKTEPVADNIAPKPVEQEAKPEQVKKAPAVVNTPKPAETAKPSVNGLEFRLQLAALHDKAMWRINKIRQQYAIKDAAKEEFTDNWYKYTVGSYASLEQAQSAKDKVVAKGYSNLYIVAYYNGKRITITEAKNMSK